jgi:zinc transport system substrate-binding protein
VNGRSRTELRHLGCILLLALSPSVVACSEAPETQLRASHEGPTGVVSVYTVNYPLLYFSERIGGAHVRVSLPAPPDVDPALWSPDGDTVAAYQGADLVIENGAGYAQWLAHASLPSAHRVDTSAAFGDRLLAADRAITHGHGPGGAHSHAATAFTTWLDPTLAVMHARAIEAALAAARPAAADVFAAGLAALENDLADLDRRLRDSTRDLAGESLLFSHPVYAYFMHRYGLSGRALDWEPGEMPSPGSWRALDEMLEVEPARILIAEGALHPDAVARLAERNVVVVVVAPCANRPVQGDWLDTMRANANRLAAVGTRAESGR